MNHYKTLIELNCANGIEAPQHPLISMHHCSNGPGCSVGDREFTTDFYMIGFKKIKAGAMLYGRTRYDHANGSMFFVKPRQVVEFQNLELEEDGFLMFFHEDFLTGHFLHQDIKRYNFFDYETNEALHLSPREEAIVWDLYKKIEGEYLNNPDEYSRDIMLTHIDSILKYSQRFFKRQFINRTILSGKTVSKFNQALSAYFEKGELSLQGLPTVNMMAEKLNLSPRYLSDLLKQETGKTAIELIHIFLIAEAKHLLKAADHSVAEIAYTLGFENLPYFSRLFKKEVGLSPVQFKKHELN